MLRKSNNWDSSAEVIRREHRMTSLQHRERKKRSYTKLNNEFWTKLKQDVAKKTKRKCVSTQHDMLVNQTEVQVCTGTKSADQVTINNQSGTERKKRKSKPKKKKKC